MAARAAGLTDIGENYASELQAKAPGPRGRSGIFWAPCSATRWVRWRRWSPSGRGWPVSPRGSGSPASPRVPRILVQIDYTGLPGRNGCAPEEVAALVAVLRGLDLDVQGLMTVAPPDPAGAAAAFGSLGRAGRRAGPARTVDGDERGPGSGRGCRVHHGTGGSGPVRGANAGQSRVVVPPAPNSRHYAVPEQEKVWHPRS